MLCGGFLLPIRTFFLFLQAPGYRLLVLKVILGASGIFHKTGWLRAELEANRRENSTSVVKLHLSPLSWNHSRSRATYTLVITSHQNSSPLGITSLLPNFCTAILILSLAWHRDLWAVLKSHADRMPGLPGLPGLPRFAVFDITQKNCRASRPYLELNCDARRSHGVV